MAERPSHHGDPGPASGGAPPPDLPDLLKSGAPAVALRLVSVVFITLSTILFSRLLGVTDYGRYAFAAGLIQFGLFFAQLAVPVLVVRNVAQWRLSGDWGLIRALMRFAVLLAVVSVGLWATLLFTAHTLSTAFQDRITPLALALVLATIFIIVLGNGRAAAIRALGRPALGLVPTMGIRPVAVVGLALVVVLLAPTLMDSPEEALMARFGGALAGLILAFVLMRRRLPRPLPPRAPMQARDWSLALLPFALTAGANAVNLHADGVMVGFLSSPAETGFFRIGFQLSTFVLMVQEALNMVIQPSIAMLHRAGDLAGAQALIRRQSRIVTLAAIGFFALYLAANRDLISLLYGDAFLAAAPVLTVLAAGKLANALTGPCGLVLNMTGHERVTLAATALAALGNVALNAVLIPPLGAWGAALATLFAMVAVHGSMMIMVRRRTGLVTSWALAPLVRRIPGPPRPTGGTQEDA
ncbi:lipopolysaccharide biosynthesis protein [Yunchengibacter salinarum]|uniref:lipopolysaccharide biosynthesis protein n=1 Tax=Yunchengibacter salinarum TaxID=3133399 RepID=UPI0035B58E0B